MKNFIMGIIVGVLLGGGIAYAANRITLISGSGTETGTSSNPLYIQAI